MKSLLIFSVLVAITLSASLIEPPLFEKVDNSISEQLEPIMHIYGEGYRPRLENEEKGVALADVSIDKELPSVENTTRQDIEEIVNEQAEDFKKLKEDVFRINHNVSGTPEDNGRHTDCQSYYDSGKRSNGVYLVHPNRSPYSFNVSCDFTTDPGHGWTNIMKRTDGEAYFYRNWNIYANGFGGQGFDHWLGLEKIKYLANQRPSELRIDLYDCSGRHRYAEYNYFALGEADAKYELLLGVYRAGDAGDALSFHRYQRFSTYDQDNDAFAGNCASLYKGGWWYNDCYESNLHGLYFGCDSSSVPPGHAGVTWKTFNGFSSSLERVEMKIRPKDH